MSQNTLDFQAIKALLPHRYPMLLVDRVCDFQLDTWIEGYKLLSGNEVFFQGHFPEQPVMPGVLMLEACAQLAGVLILKSLHAREGVVVPSYCYFAGIDGVRFKRMVVPGDRLDLRAEVVKEKKGGAFWKLSVCAQVEGVLACKADIMLVGSKD
jgi:3-hydroxyacyl-[acyl-carrier-protein] dehydratase